MVTSDFIPEVEIPLFRTWAMKNMQYNPYLWPNCRNFPVLKEIGVEKHDCDVRFKSESVNMAVSCKRNASGHNIGTVRSLWTCGQTCGQILRSTERISTFTECLWLVILIITRLSERSAVARTRLTPRPRRAPLLFATRKLYMSCCRYLGDWWQQQGGCTVTDDDGVTSVAYVIVSVAMCVSRCT